MGNRLEQRMDILTSPGKKVVFVYPDDGYPCDQETAAQHLVVGKSYTVASTVVHDWVTEVFLTEVPGVSFNSVMFRNGWSWQ